MTVYWILLLITAFIAYTMGSLSTVVITSNFVFHRNLHALGTSNRWLSNFRRIYGVGGFIKLLLVEIIKDLLPILIGGWLLGIKDHAVVGRAFAGFCLVLGRLFPVFYGFRGSHASITMVVAAMCVDFSIGITMALFIGGISWFTRYISLGTIVGAFVQIMASLLILDDKLVVLLGVITAVLIIIRHIPAISRLLNGREPKLSLVEDISYKFDEKF